MARRPADRAWIGADVLVNSLAYRFWKLFVILVPIAGGDPLMYPTTAHDDWDPPHAPGGWQNPAKAGGLQYWDGGVLGALAGGAWLAGRDFWQPLACYS